MNTTKKESVSKMKFDKTFRQLNTKFEQQKEDKATALAYIAEIDKYIQYADDTSEYDQVKKQVQAFVPTEYNVFALSEDQQQALQNKLTKLNELAESLK